MELNSDEEAGSWGRPLREAVAVAGRHVHWRRPGVEQAPPLRRSSPVMRQGEGSSSEDEGGIAVGRLTTAPRATALTAPRDARVRALCTEAGRLHEALRRESAGRARACENAAAAEARALAAERSAGQAAFTVRRLQEELQAARCIIESQTERTAATVSALRSRLADVERTVALQHQQRGSGSPAALGASQRECRRLAAEVDVLRSLQARSEEEEEEAEDRGGGHRELHSAALSALRSQLSRAQRSAAESERGREEAERQLGEGPRLQRGRAAAEAQQELQEARAEAKALARELAVARADAAAAAAEAEGAKAELAEHQADIQSALELIGGAKTTGASPARRAAAQRNVA